MTEKQTKPAAKKSKLTPKKLETSKPAAFTEKESNNSSFNGLVLFILLSLVNISAFGYLWYENQQHSEQRLQAEQEQKKHLQVLTEQVKQQQTLFEKLSTNKHQELELIRQKMESLGRLTLTMQSQLNLTQQKLNQAGKDVNQDLIISEADFLIRTAAIRLLLTQNVSETTNLLKAADKKLLKINDVAIFPVRAALTKDLYQLKATTQIDVIGSYLILENIEKSISKLKINFILPEVVESKNTETKTDQGWFQHLSETTVNVIHDWFQVTHYNEEVKPLASVQQDLLIKQSLVLLIKQAQWALIQKNISLYQLTLKKLSEQIGGAFNKQDVAVITALVEIKSLLSESMVTPVAKYLNSEKAMTIYIDSNEESQKE